jgi:hypothetical protein
MKMPNVMLDLETFGTSPNSVILAIGAVHFETEIVSIFYQRVDPQSCVNHGLVMDVATILWWLDQADAARREVITTSRMPLPEALRAFSVWIPASSQVWGNGASFDNVILGSAYAACGMVKPWDFYDDRCYRTLKALKPGIQMTEPPTIKHHALADARAQALHCIKLLQGDRRPVHF